MRARALALSIAGCAIVVAASWKAGQLTTAQTEARLTSGTGTAPTAAAAPPAVMPPADTAPAPVPSPSAARTTSVPVGSASSRPASSPSSAAPATRSAPSAAPRPRAPAPRATPVAPAPPPAPSGSFAGSTAQTPYGPVQVRIDVRQGTITDVVALQLTDDSPTSVAISAGAAPVLRREALTAQSAQIDTVSGATYTSEGYRTSLQSAIDAARR